MQMYSVCTSRLTLIQVFRVKLIFITNDPLQAQEMSSAGVDRIMVDLEINGKAERQGHLDTVISHHTFSDISVVREALPCCGSSELMVRINPLGPDSGIEIDEVICRGADRIMLPMFTHPSQVSCCLDLIAGRVPLTLLLETSAALARLPQILSLPGLDDFHIGLNDLHLDMGLDFMFELFTSGLLSHAAELFHKSGLHFGIGGISCIGSGILPAELILASHMNLGSSRVILSRSFAKSVGENRNLSDEIRSIRRYLSRGDIDFLSTYQQLCSIVEEIVSERRSNLAVK